MRLEIYGILAMLSALSACAAVPEERPPVSIPFAGLAGTSWQLVEIQSMDDATRISRPGDPSDYTLTFDADGSLRAKLDCNRGSGTWRNDIANATGGTLALGPMAATKALCPEPTLGETLERQLPYVRTFTIRDGRMNMALMADGGIIVWEPVKKPK